MISFLVAPDKRGVGTGLGKWTKREAGLTLENISLEMVHWAGSVYMSVANCASIKGNRCLRDKKKDTVYAY